MLRAPRSFVWWGSHAALLATPEGRGALADERLAGIVWRNPEPILKNAVIDSLDQLGFDSFHIMHDLAGLLLQAGAANARNAITVSLRRARIAEIAGTSTVEETAIEGNSTVAETEPDSSFRRKPESREADVRDREFWMTLHDSVAHRTAPASAGMTMAAVPSPLLEPAGEAAARPVAITIGIDWPIGTTSGWQVYGMNLAAQLATRDGVDPVLAFLPDPRDLAPLARFSLRETFASSTRRGATAPGVALRALGNGLEASSVPCWLDAAKNVGVVFFEDTLLTETALASGRSYDLIVAGSSWNADVLRANGLDNVALSLQGIDPTLFHPAPPSGLFGDRFVVFSGGKLEYRKGQDIVIPAFREFHRRHPEALLVFGWHNYWPHIMEEITVGGHVGTPPKVSASGEIDFTSWLLRQGLPKGSFLDLGMVPNVQMGQLLRDTHVGLFPNRAEGGTNLVAMELMACGIPAILSANTGHLDLFEGSGAYALNDQGPVRQGRFCAGNDGWGESSVEEIIEALELVHSDRADAGRRGALGATFMASLSWSRQTDHLLSVLAPLL